jgi:hypothetical protein
MQAECIQVLKNAEINITNAYTNKEAKRKL